MTKTKNTSTTKTVLKMKLKKNNLGTDKTSVKTTIKKRVNSTKKKTLQKLTYKQNFKKIFGKNSAFNSPQRCAYNFNVLKLLNKVNVNMFDSSNTFSNDYDPLHVSYNFAVDKNTLKVYLLNNYNNFQKLLALKSANKLKSYDDVMATVYPVTNKEHAKTLFNDFNCKKKKKTKKITKKLKKDIIKLLN